MRYCYGGDDPVGSYRKGNRHDGANMDYRKTRALDLLDYRCTATSAGTSGGSDNYGINVVVL